MPKYKLVRGTYKSGPGELVEPGQEVDVDDAFVKHIGPGVFVKVGSEPAPKTEVTTPKIETPKVQKGGK